MAGDAGVSEHTILAPDDRGTIKCRECGRVFPEHSKRTYYGGGRSGWALLADHVRARHPALGRELNEGLAAFDRANSLIIAEGRALCAPARNGNARGD